MTIKTPSQEQLQQTIRKGDEIHVKVPKTTEHEEDIPDGMLGCPLVQKEPRIWFLQMILNGKEDINKELAAWPHLRAEH